MTNDKGMGQQGVGEEEESNVDDVVLLVGGGGGKGSGVGKENKSKRGEKGRLGYIWV